MLHVLPLMFKPFNNLICCKTVLMWVVRRATSLFNSFCSNVARQKTCNLLHVFCCPFFRTFNACLQGGGGPQIGEATCGGSPHLSCKRDQIKMRDYMDRQLTKPKRITSPTWVPPPPCKQALSACRVYMEVVGTDR